MSTATVNGRRHRADVTVPVGSAAPTKPADDDDATRKAILEVVQVWLDRLQLISVITTFFASIDGTLLGFMTSTVRLGIVDVDTWSNTTQLMTASMTGALVFHICAAITSFIGSFVLIRYKLLDAKQHEHQVERTASSSGHNPYPSGTLLEKPHLAHAATISTSALPSQTRNRHRANSSLHGFASHSLDFLPNFADIITGLQGRVSINRVHLFDCLRPRKFARDDGDGDLERGMEPRRSTEAELGPPVKLLSRCHSLSAAMALFGFLLAVLGIIAFVWVSLPQSIAIFASACLGACFVLGMIVFATA
ncbi:hypothetical protein EIP91_011032 [Steccherinum ochraceum]|uniref:Transmembrane protein n=1 Tax=Steccherinum ochraceum TaxID=92696 RepID=A0A4R0RBR7_9APHY|nr:hypothetical protein EIP91_011032 [Steccherinum ochraceum]